MFSQTAIYALRAIVYIAQQEHERPVGAKEIADVGEIPPNYLSKILRELVRDGLLDSARGVGGGFRMANPPDQIFVRDIIQPFEDLSRRGRCLWGYPDCTRRNPCPFDAKWRPLVEALDDFIENTIFADIVPESYP